MKRIEKMKAAPKWIHNFKVLRLDGVVYDLYQEGILVNGLTVPDPEPQHHDEEIEGAHGHFTHGTDLKGRELHGKFTLMAVDQYDYELLRNRAFQIFDSREPFYIIRDLEPGKRLLVRKTGAIVPSRSALTLGEFDLGFVSESAFFESVGTSLDPKTFDSDLWQWGQGLPLEAIEYRHRSSEFMIYNAGDEWLDPKQIQAHFEVRIRGVATGNITIRNTTTGESYIFRGGLAAGDLLEIKGIRTFKNGTSAFSDTNTEVFSLAPGRNFFTVTGLSQPDIEFDFRFYYL